MQAVQVQPQRKLHPIIWAAAISVIVFSLVAVGAITGLIPATLGQSAAEKAVAPQAALTPPAEQPATPPAIESPAARAVEETSQPAAKPAPKAVHKPVPARASPPKAVAPAHATKPEPVRAAAAPAEAPAAPPAPAVCHECGIVSSVRAIEQKGEGTGIGAVGGAVAGGVLGRQIGGGRGRDVMTVVGAIAGGLGGHEIEKNVRKVVKHEVTVRFEDGSTRSFSYDKAPMFRNGDHVRLAQGELVLDNR